MRRSTFEHRAFGPRAGRVTVRVPSERAVRTPGAGSLARCLSRRAFTLVELVVAVGLASILMLAVVSLLDSSLNLWSRGEVKRALVEQSAGTAEVIVRDFRMLHPGEQGDLVCEWVAFDADGDGLRERFWPRVRMVRLASAAEIAALEASPADLLAAPVAADEQRAEGQRAERAPTGAREGSAEDEPADENPEQLTRRPPSAGLIEVAWCILPDGSSPDRRETGVLWRRQQLREPGIDSVFSPGYFGSDGSPPAGQFEVVTGGVLWCGTSFATQTTLLENGWTIGTRMDEACGSWDAWNGGRPDVDVHEWNEPGAGMPRAAGSPLLPRRVRFELEFEGENDRKRRTRLAEAVEPLATGFEVLNGERLPDAGQFVLIGAEWMEVTAARGDHLSVKRARRGTAAVPHKAGEMVHYGETVAIEVPIRVHVGYWSY